MSPASHESKQIRRSQSSDPTSKGNGRKKPQKTKQPRVRSVLIEPRDNEPPRVSVSVSYDTDKAPEVKALQKLAMETIHGVVKEKPTLVDLGYRHQQRSRELVQMFEVREKGEGGG